MSALVGAFMRIRPFGVYLLGTATTLLLAIPGVGFSAARAEPPFIAGDGYESSMVRSGQGDGVSTPAGTRLRCARGRHYTLLVTVRNRSATPVRLTGATKEPPSPIIRRVGVQFRLAPPPPKGDILVIGLRPWSRSEATPLTVPPGRSAYLQSNYVMGQCSQLQPQQRLIVNRSITISYRADGRNGSQQITVRAARMILTR